MLSAAHDGLAPANFYCTLRASRVKLFETMVGWACACCAAYSGLSGVSRLPVDPSMRGTPGGLGWQRVGRVLSASHDGLAPANFYCTLRASRVTCIILVNYDTLLVSTIITFEWLYIIFIIFTVILYYLMYLHVSVKFPRLRGLNKIIIIIII